MLDDLFEIPRAGQQLFPVSAVWAMRFSWSSFVSQFNVVSCCLTSGLKIEDILSLDRAVPIHQEELCGVATDDVLLMHRCHHQARRRLARLESVMEKRGINNNENKAIDCAAEVDALGCDLSSKPQLVDPSLEKLGLLVSATLDVLFQPLASLLTLNGLLGTYQCFFLMQRPRYSMLDQCYEYVRFELEKSPQALSMKVQSELLIAFVFLLPLLLANLDRPFADELLACNAAPSFGFGLSLSRCGKSVCADVGRLAERRGDYARLPWHPLEEQPMSRLGNLHKFGLRLKDFIAILSCQARWASHSGVLEAHG